MTKKCDRKWVKLNVEIAKEYGIKPILCKTCNKLVLPFFLHDLYGDYTCFNCEQSGEIKHFCMTCKNS